MKYDYKIPGQYETVRREYIDDIDAEGLILYHKKSGARVALIPCEDTNKLFCVTFFTPPDNSRGAPHITEHSVLQGSRKYPAREPFMQLEKGSLNTFLNAMTYPDKTMYPVSSCNDEDFKILTDVYLDSVFFPNIYKREEIFMQEGWHYEPEEDGSVSVNGIVYSEMKGKDSSPDSNVFDELLRALFPDSVYGNCSGGEPDDIPDLSYEEFLDFHRKYYHPSNSFIMFYGNFDVEERLSYLDSEYLSQFDKIPAVRGVAHQKRYGSPEPRRVLVDYPIGEDEDPRGRSYIALGSLVADVQDEVACAAWDILGELLVNDPAAPVKKALSDAGIGQEVYGGFLDYIGEPFFAVIAKNTDPSRESDFLRIVRETLEKIRTEGIGEKTLNSIIERTEFKFRESAYGSYPKGLDLFRMMLKGWLYTDGDPFKYIRILGILSKLKEKVGTGWFEGLIGELLSSDHSAVVTLSPERKLAEKKEKDLCEKLRAFRESISDNEFEELKRKYEKFREYQEAPETEEERNCIPVLPRGCISEDPEPISNAECTLGGHTAVRHDIQTNGIVYLKLYFDVSGVPADDLPYLDLMVELLGNCATEDHGFGELVDDVRINAGGLDFDTASVRNYKDPSVSYPFVTVSLRALNGKIVRSVGLLREILTGTRFSDLKRIREVLGETVSSKSRDILFNGDEFASTRCLSYTDPSSVFTDMIDGLGSFSVQNGLYSDFDRVAGSLSAKLSELAEKVFTRSGIKISIACGDEAFPDADRAMGELLGSLPDRREPGSGVLLPLGVRNEAFSVASQVQYVAMTADSAPVDRGLRARSIVTARAISTEILYPEIRVKGGAYGAYCSISPDTGKITLSSYRDPNLGKTVDVFASVFDMVRSLRPDSDKLWQLIIGSFSRIDRPLSAYQKASRSMLCRLSGKTYEDMRNDRAAILSVTPESFLEEAERLASVRDSHEICVIGGENKIRSERKLFGEIRPVFN